MDAITANVVADIIGTAVIAIGVIVFRHWLRTIRTEFDGLKESGAASDDPSLRDEIIATRDLCARAVVLSAKAEASAARCEEKLNLLLLASDNSSHV